MQLFSCEIREVFKNTVFQQIPPVAASEIWKYMLKGFKHLSEFRVNYAKF